MSVRKGHVEKVLDVGNRAGDSSRDMNVVAEYTMYGAMWLVCECQSYLMHQRAAKLIIMLVKFFGAFWLKTLMNYDVIAEVEKVSKNG